MPFITRDRRSYLDQLGTIFDIQPGDICYYHYKKMVEKWEDIRRWATAHNIYRNMEQDIKADVYSPDQAAAYRLAWQVFFQLHVMPYELEQRAKNGDI